MPKSCYKNYCKVPKSANFAKLIWSVKFFLKTIGFEQNKFILIPSDTFLTLTHGRLKVHGGVPIVLCIFVDPLWPRINYLVFKECLIALFLNPES